MKTPEELAELKAQVLYSHSHGFAVGGAAGIVAELAQDLDSDEPGPKTVKHSAEHILELIAQVELVQSGLAVPKTQPTKKEAPKADVPADKKEKPKKTEKTEKTEEPPPPPAEEKKLEAPAKEDAAPPAPEAPEAPKAEAPVTKEEPKADKKDESKKA